MVEKTKSREITITDAGGTFNTFFRHFRTSGEYDFEGLALLRKLLSNEKARLLHTIKKKNPKSLYALAKLVKRDFKSVSDDMKVLEKFGLVEMIAEKTGKRERLKPMLVVDSLKITIKFV